MSSYTHTIIKKNLSADLAVPIILEEVMGVISLELNELNFDVVKQYIADGELSNFSALLEKCQIRETVSEKKYRNLEPWIQWPTIYSGLDYEGHGLFRLGDCINSNHQQIFERIEAMADRPVVAISPMNAVNKVSDRSIFIPDPWTKTDVTGPWDCQIISKIVNKLVNNNSHGLGLTMKDAVLFLACLAKNVNIRLLMPMFKEVVRSIKHKWAKPLVLDLVLSMLFISKVDKLNPVYASLFLNAGAHIQHHYTFSSAKYKGKLSNPEWFIKRDVDPLLAVYKVYDRILGVISKVYPDKTIFIATGLSQLPNPKMINYYRPKDHLSLLSRLGFDGSFVSLDPRMSRDFLVNFNSQEDAELFTQRLTDVKLTDGSQLFDADLRSNSVFCKVAYHGLPDSGLQVVRDGDTGLDFAAEFSHVTIENGIHRTTGYLVRTDKSEFSQEESSIPLKSVHDELVTSCAA